MKKQTISYKLSKEDKDNIVKSYLNGEDHRDIAKRYEVDESTIRYTLRKKEVWRPKGIHRIYSIDETFFENIDTEIKAYVLGFAYSDGYISEKHNEVVWTIQERDIDILEKIKKALNYDKEIINVEYKKQVKLNFKSKKMTEDLVKLGCIQAKSLIKKFPTEIDKEVFRHFLRGYFDGNGSIMFMNEKYLKVSIVSSFDFIEGLAKFIDEELGIKYKIRTCGKKKLNKTLNINGGLQALKLLEYMYEDSTIFGNRKKEKYDKAKALNMERVKKEEDRKKIVCKICGEKNLARGYCDKHYHEYYRKPILQNKKKDV